MHAASHHVVNSDVTMRDYGAVFLGLSEDSLRM
jgi:hypothetical protein